MKVSIESLAHRSLQKLENFHVGDSSDWNFLDGENLIGVYSDEKSPSVAFSNLGLWPSKSLFISYLEIAEARVEEEKDYAENIVLVTDDKRTLNVPISGGNGRFRDVWEVLRFINRARSASRGD